MNINEINELIKETNEDTDLISDGWHTFGELYKYRQELYIKLCEQLSKNGEYKTWKSKKHNDGDLLEGYFVLGITLKEGEYISYHMKEDGWDKCFFAEELERSPITSKYNSKMALKNMQKL